jgi:type I restriction enzyme, S subunit
MKELRIDLHLDPRLDLSPAQWAIVREVLLRRVPKFEVWAFGSRTTGKAKLYSDLDLAIITSEPLDWSASAALADDFAESDLPFKVDVVDWASTSTAFRKIIDKDKVVIQRAALQSSNAA